MKYIWIGWLLTVCMVMPVAAMEWQQLEQMRVAIQQQSYHGEFLHRRGDQTSVYSIVHQFRDDKSTELLRQLDGDMIEVLRKGEQVICYFPPGTQSAANSAIPAAPFSQISVLDLTQISANYQAQSLGQERVAGYLTNIIELKSDNWRFHQKLWLEAETKLLLQSEILNSKGQVLEQFRFTRIELDNSLDRSLFESKLADKEGVMQQVSERTMPAFSIAANLHTTVGWAPAGFELVRAKPQMHADGWIDQFTYSDGLASYTVFVSMSAENSKPTGLAKMGATLAFMAQQDELSITVVGEVPMQTARQIAQNIKTQDF